jgi:hypothetical protein
VRSCSADCTDDDDDNKNTNQQTSSLQSSRDAVVMVLLAPFSFPYLNSLKVCVKTTSYLI